jgi:predicted metal-dependent phosphoesterase TrpH
LARPHFAEFLVEQGHCKNVAQAFKKYLGKGKPGDVPCDWPDMIEVIRIIQSGGGVCVLAHPDKYGLSASRLRQLLDDFAQAGGDGIEVVSGAQDQQSSRYLASQATKRGLLVSTGSDFHSPEQVWCDVGGQKELPSGAKPIWLHPNVSGDLSREPQFG